MIVTRYLAPVTQSTEDISPVATVCPSCREAVALICCVPNSKREGMKLSFLSCHTLSGPTAAYKVIPALILKNMVGTSGSSIPLSEEDLEYLVNDTNIDRDTIAAQYQVFLTKHPDCQISKSSFYSILSSCYSVTSVHRVARHIWRMYDTNMDGFIDFREFLMVLHVMKSGSSEDNLRQIFRVFDIDNDGKIDLEEMKVIVKDLIKLENNKKEI